MNTDTINNIREQAEKIKEIVRLQEIKEHGLRNNRQMREQAQVPYAERLVNRIKEVRYKCPNCKRIITKPNKQVLLLCGCGYEMQEVLN